MVCSICKKSGHNKTKCPINKEELSTSSTSASSASSTTSNTAVIVEADADILLSTYWKNTKTFRSIKDKQTQLKYYKHMNASDEVLQLVELESKPFGSVSESIISELFGLGPRTSSQNDGTFNGKKI
jgi:hypothetical protein